MVDEQALEDINIKVVGYLRTARAAAPHLVANGWGRIINIGGLAIHNTGRPVATLRNVGVAAITKNLADELGPKGVNVVAVHPGVTRTERTDPQSAKCARELQYHRPHRRRQDRVRGRVFRVAARASPQRRRDQCRRRVTRRHSILNLPESMNRERDSDGADREYRGACAMTLGGA